MDVKISQKPRVMLAVCNGPYLYLPLVAGESCVEISSEGVSIVESSLLTLLHSSEHYKAMFSGDSITLNL